MAASIVRHKNCGEPVTIFTKPDDVAIYIGCEHCQDLVEVGELELTLSEQGDGGQGDQINRGVFYLMESNGIPPGGGN